MLLFRKGPLGQPNQDLCPPRFIGQTWPGAGLSSREGWRESEKTASQFTEIEKAKGLLWDRGHVYLREIRGLQNNGDVKPRAIAV